MKVDRFLENVGSTCLQLDRLIDKAERAGSNFTTYPFVGTVAGALKIAGGIIQIITAIACTILFSIPALSIGEGHWLMRYCFAHILHGMGNILAGTLEAIPFVGMGLEKMRKTFYENDVFVTDSELGKFMPYGSLRYDDTINNRITYQL